MSKTKEWNKLKEIGVRYIFWGMFILFISHKLFTDSIRFDEAVEWYVSKNRFGNMYNLICSTFQPPLYNVVMHFWLMINDSSEWFRIFNMVCETLGAVALYKTVKSITQKKTWGYIAVAISLCFCSLLYYNQISGEYPLVLCCIAWCIYFFTKCLDDMSTKYLLLWVLFCILSMYSQYGAFIPVVSMAIVLFFVIVQGKDWKVLKQFFLFCGLAALVAGGILISFFLLTQMKHQGAGIEFEISMNRLIQEPFEAIQFLVYAFSTRHHYRNVVMGGGFAFVVICMLGSKKEGIHIFWNRKLTWHYIACIMTWCLYCFATWTGIYGYGMFGTRHTIICLPSIFYIVSVSLWIFYELLDTCEMKKGLKNACKCSLLMILLIGMYNSFGYIHEHWNYEQDDMAYEAWYNNVDESTITYVYWYCVPQFMYYHNVSEEDFYQYFMGESDGMGNLIFPKSTEGMSYEEFEQYFLSSYGDLQDRYIFICSNEGNEIDNVMHLFENEGYTMKVLLDESATREYLFER